MALSRKNFKKEEEKQPQKSERIILKHTQEAALREMGRSTRGLSLSGISAGLDLGFSVMLMIVVLTLFEGIFSEPVLHLLASNMYPIGFIFVVLGRSELFTEHTTLAVLPVLQRLASIKKLIRLWVIVYLSNIAGGLVFALILTHVAGTIHLLKISALEKIALSFVEYSGMMTLLTAALAGWLMGLLAWLVAAARETISQIFIIWIITASIGLAGLPHCIVGNIEVVSGVIAGSISFAEYLSFLIPTTIGNALGGVLFVGVLKFSHVAFSGIEVEIDIEDIDKKPYDS